MRMRAGHFENIVGREGSAKAAEPFRAAHLSNFASFQWEVLDSPC